MFLFRYCVLDVGLWLQGHSELETPGEVMRISLPDTKDIVSSRIVTDLAANELILYSRPSSKNYMIGRTWSSLLGTFVLAHERLFQ